MATGPVVVTVRAATEADIEEAALVVYSVCFPAISAVSTLVSLPDFPSRF
jgi:hypothetical protein